MNTEFFVNLFKKPEAASINFVHRDDLVAGLQQFENGVDSREAAGKCESPGSFFKACDEIFQNGACGIIAPRIVIPFMYAGGFLYKGGSLVNGNRNRPGQWINRDAVNECCCFLHKIILHAHYGFFW